MTKINIESLTPGCILEIAKYYEKKTNNKFSFMDVLGMTKIDLDILSTECLVNIILNKTTTTKKELQPYFEWEKAIRILVNNNLINDFFNIIIETDVKRKLIDLLGEKHIDSIMTLRSNSIKKLGEKIGNKELGKNIYEKYINQHTDILKLVGDNGGRDILYKVIKTKYK